MLFKSLDRTEVRNNGNGSTLIFPFTQQSPTPHTFSYLTNHSDRSRGDF